MIGTGAWLLAPRPAPQPVAGGSSLSPREAMERALALHQRLRYTESLPFYRIARADAGKMPDVHRLYGRALYASTFELREDGTLLSRSSFERIAAMRIADAEMTHLERLALGPEDRWEALDARGLSSAYWGFPWDALQYFRKAAEAAPAAQAHFTVAAMEDRLHRPDRSTLPLSGSQP